MENIEMFGVDDFTIDRNQNDSLSWRHRYIGEVAGAFLTCLKWHYTFYKKKHNTKISVDSVDGKYSRSINQEMYKYVCTYVAPELKSQHLPGR